MNGGMSDHEKNSPSEEVAAQADAAEQPVKLPEEDAAASGEASKEVAAAEAAVLPAVAREQLPSVIEALLFVHGDPIQVSKLVDVTRTERAVVLEALAELAKRYEAAASGVQVVEVGERWQIRTKPECAEYIKAMQAIKPKRLTAAALETLAVIAYRQPVVKSDIEKIRGVDVTPTLKTLIDRNLVAIIGQQATVGQPSLYGTTDEFLKIFGLRSLGDLPKLRELREIEEDPGESEEQDDSAPGEEPASEPVEMH
jgi:segregation and condensation protein B